jgi:uncharacterized protein GlcG (DUF336 family)
MRSRIKIGSLIVVLSSFGLLFALFAVPALAGNEIPGDSCDQLPSHAKLLDAISTTVHNADGTGFDLEAWATIVNRDGVVCAVAFTGIDRGSQWPGSRVISAQKANTANSFSLPGLALSTANLYALAQPGGSLYGLKHSNPVDAGVAYQVPSGNFGQSNDPMVGNRIGGVNVFGGGLALYDGDGDGDRTLLGGIGMSGDASCRDHLNAKNARAALGLDNTPNSDDIIFDIEDDKHGNPESASAFGHPTC